MCSRPDDSIDAQGVGAEFRATPITNAKAVKSVVEKFRERYGAEDVKKYYSKFDVAVEGALPKWDCQPVPKPKLTAVAF